MTADFPDLRTKMVDNQIRTTDVTNVAVLDAFLAVPREEFVPAAWRDLAYIDEDIPLKPASAAGEPARYLMEPSPFAKLLQLASIQPGDHVLDIGAGTGYSAAVLSRIAGSVVAVESDSDLAAQAATRMVELGFNNVVIATTPMPEGDPSRAPYDVIVIEGAVDFVPDALFGQLKNGGRLVAVEGRGNAGIARFYMKDEGIVSGRGAFNLAVKELTGFSRVPQFQF
ncbi:protein-L-isoaspartate O-methyltransferase family protein [Phyllobacterium leguminum]|uniref:Protein-L-isoaspartate O-methyltransferase n=1 Tax=Phyllobacterium leguminum TaxID=314237 RepID=A0A318T1X4_9HYPH|nr:protein-L-isoaspartate O-methyltransferase [Phyllobacterium leguminum]PYE84204.1 protein-L-isoaspartate(D-aspartate) O-methyltransferase [Phyllobacterium leguminum]